MRELYVHLHVLSAPEGPAGDWVAADRAGDQSPWLDRGRVVPDPPPFAGLTWTTSTTPIGDRAWRVQRHVDIEQPGPPSVGVPTSGLKQVSLVRRRPDIDLEEFTDRYRGHVHVVRAHHGVSAYAQSVDLEPVYGVDDDSHRVDGISELWFTDRAAWRDRFYLSDDSVDVVRQDTSAFIDYRTTVSVLSDEIRYR